MDAANFHYRHPEGDLYGMIASGAVRALRLPYPAHPLRPHLLHSAPNVVLGRTLRLALEHYFAGAPETFDAIPVDFSGGTDFERSVWTALRAVPWGTTTTYAELAVQLGRPAGAARAVGRALGANPLHLLLPCHRVVGRSGGLVNYAAGLAWKRRLLALEGILIV